MTGPVPVKAQGSQPWHLELGHYAQTRAPWWSLLWGARTAGAPPEFPRRTLSYLSTVVSQKAVFAGMPAGMRGRVTALLWELPEDSSRTQD